MIRCSELLEEYSDYRDGLLEGGRADAIEEHLHGCSSCSRYDRVVSGGVAELRRIPELTPSDDFLARLQHRIYHLDDDVRGWRREASGAPVGLAVALCLVIALTAWIPVIAPRPATVTLAPVAARLEPAPRPIPSVFLAGPLLTGDAPAAPTHVRTLGLASNATQTPLRVTFRTPGSVGP